MRSNQLSYAPERLGSITNKSALVKTEGKDFMHFSYKTHGTCSALIEFDLNDNIVTNVTFRGGCHGNLQGISKLVEGSDANEVIKRLRGIRCGFKPTSCPDQLAEALSQALSE